jgi:hypothetical protein
VRPRQARYRKQPSCFQSHPYNQQKLGRRNQSGVSTELFLSFTPRSFPTGIRDGDRRELRELGPCSLGRRNVCHDLAAVAIRRQVQESPVRGSNADKRPPVLRRGPPVASSLRFGRPIGAHRPWRNIDTQLHRQLRCAGWNFCVPQRLGFALGKR